MGSYFQDIRYAIRSLKRSPGFVATALVTLALGIGVNTAIFSVVNAVLFQPPQFARLADQVVIKDLNVRRGRNAIEVNPSSANFLDWREQSHSFDHIVAWRNWYFTLAESAGGRDVPESVRGVRVSPAFFTMLGVSPAQGRTFTASEEEPGRSHVVLISDGLWRRRFGGDPAILGRTLLIDAQPFVVIGVLPRDFYFFLPGFDVWMPLAVDETLHDRRDHSVMVFARLAPGVSVEQAQAEMDGITQALEHAYPDTNTGWRSRITSLYPTQDVKDLRPALLVLQGAVALVMLIAAANVANLLLARATSRQREISIRLTLGATRWRLIQQLLTESMLLSAVGAAAGLIVARVTLDLIGPLLPQLGTFRQSTPTIDLRVLAFTVAIALVTGIVFGLAPALQLSRTNQLRGASVPHGRHGAGQILMVAELALSIVLVVGALLLVTSLWHLQTVNPGFRVDHLQTMQAWLPKAKYPQPAAVSSFYSQVTSRVRELPQVEAVGAVNFRPFSGMSVGTRIEIAGQPQKPADVPTVSYRVASPGYFRLLGVRIVAGRDLEERDARDAAGAVVINQTMARRFWPDQNPLGRQIWPAFSKSVAPWASCSASPAATGPHTWRPHSG